MKKKFSTIEYEGERAREVIHTCRETMKKVKHINVLDIFAEAVKQPSSRYWVSEDRAIYVMRRMLRGDDLSYMRQTKRKMFYELFWRFIECKRKHEDAGVCNIVRKIIYTPASSFFLTSASAKAIYYKHKDEK
jgi:hypothetical protein